MRLQLNQSEFFLWRKMRALLQPPGFAQQFHFSSAATAGSRGRIDDDLEVQHRTQFPHRIWWYANLVPAAASSSSSWSSSLVRLQDWKPNNNLSSKKSTRLNPSNLQTFLLFASHGFHMQTIWRTSSCWTHSTWGYSPCHHEVGSWCWKTLFEEEMESKQEQQKEISGDQSMKLKVTSPKTK